MKTIKVESLLEYLKEEKYWLTIGLAPTYDIEVDIYGTMVQTKSRILLAAMPTLLHNIEFNVPVKPEQIPLPHEVPTQDFWFKYMDLGLNTVHDYFDGKVIKEVGVMKDKHTLHEISKVGAKVYDLLTNFYIYELEGYGLTIDPEDICELLYHPVVTEIRENLKSLVASDITDDKKSDAFKAAYDAVLEFIYTIAIKEMPTNGVVQHIKAGAAKIDQFLLQIVGVGSASEISSTVFPTFLTECVAEGLSSDFGFYTNIIGSSRAMMYSKTPIEDTETLHRVLQMISAEVCNVHVGDCGSTVTMPFKVTKRNFKAINGMFHIKGGKVLELNKINAQEHIGEVLDLRFHGGCVVNDPNGCCSVCGGAATRSIVLHANLGHLRLTIFIGGVSQKVLKAKHAEIISVGGKIVLALDLQYYFDVSDDNRSIVFNKGKQNVKLLFKAQATKDKMREKDRNASLLHTLHSVDNVRDTPASNYSLLNTISVLPNDPSNGDFMLDRVTLDTENWLPFSYEILEYIKANPSKLELVLGKGKIYYYTLNTDELPDHTPLFSLPFRNFDILLQYKVIKKFLSSPLVHQPGEALTDYTSMSEAAKALLELTWDTLGVDLSTLLFAIWPLSVTSIRDRNFSIVKGSDSCQFLPINRLYNERSLSIKLVYQDQKEVIGKLRSVTNNTRLPHIYDNLFSY